MAVSVVAAAGCRDDAGEDSFALPRRPLDGNLRGADEQGEQDVGGEQTDHGGGSQRLPSKH
jgi:hypothetical protein